jgi:hypothetical protein
MHASVDRSTKQSADCQKVDYEGQQRCMAFVPNQEELRQQEQTGTIEIGQRGHLSKGDIEAVNTLYPSRSSSALSPGAVQPCVVSTTTTITMAGRRTTTTRTVPCPPGGRQIVTEPPPARTRCCQGRWGMDRFCRPEGCRPNVMVSWPQPDRWCRAGWCSPRPRHLCNGWIDDGWDDGW